ncbi:MAG: thioredoxin domain-containing protein [Bacteroidetes bacterium]|nr:thioredoxin domain-containing protein [Bacteroidota bacterium]
MNLLSREKSPYLLQHQHNPVDWYPWGDEAFERAAKEQKPVFLSIGYSTCHWCHVMERESFENPEIAAVMNALFINIKVDREERPDIDKVYMSAVQTMTGHGGWPLSVFLTPDRKPFYGGTYFPPKDAHGRPGFPSLLRRISEVWKSERENVVQSGEELLRELQHRHPVNSQAAAVDEAILKRTYHQLAAGYDPKHAGFGSGTKFPRPVIFNFLFRYFHRTQDQEALKMSLTTLMAMASGGMYDHIGGGFHRYSVDPQWRVPHFEKMLYDQAQLVHSYLDAWQITHDPFFAGVVRETLGYILDRMVTPEGAFCSAEDADSADPSRQGRMVEGAFYVWSQTELSSILSADEVRVFTHHFAVEPDGNVQSDPHQEFTGKNILFNPFTPEQTAQHLGLSVQAVMTLLGSAKQKLAAHRNTRPAPLKDDKVITSWNGMMIGAMARAAAVLDAPEYRLAAERAARFLRSTMYDPATGTFHRRYREGDVRFEAHLEDYAAAASGVLELYYITADVQWLRWAEEIAGQMVTRFWDSAEGGFYDTSGKDPSVLVRMKEAYDGAEPTGNSVAAMVLLQLHRLTNDDRWREYAERTMRYFCALLEQSPQIMPQLMAAVEYYRTPPQHLVIAVESAEQAAPFLRIVASQYRPHLDLVVLTPDVRNYFTERFPFMAGMVPRGGRTAAYFCREFNCLAPTTDPSELAEQLSS